MRVTPPKIPFRLRPIDDLQNELEHSDTLSGVSGSYIQADGFHASVLSIVDSKFDHVSLSGSDFERNDMLDCSLRVCELTAAKMDAGSWQRVHIYGSRAGGIQLQDSNFKDVTFENCKLNVANFRVCRFKNVCFKDCDLTEVDFYNSSLDSVSFENCILTNLSLSQTKLRNVDLRTSDISVIRNIEGLAGATIKSLQLMAIARSLASSYKIIIKDN